MTGNLLVARTKLLESEQSMPSYAPDEGADDTGQWDTKVCTVDILYSMIIKRSNYLETTFSLQ